MAAKLQSSNDKQQEEVLLKDLENRKPFEYTAKWTVCLCLCVFFFFFSSLFLMLSLNH